MENSAVLLDPSTQDKEDRFDVKSGILVASFVIQRHCIDCSCQSMLCRMKNEMKVISGQ